MSGIDASIAMAGRTGVAHAAVAGERAVLIATETMPAVCAPLRRSSVGMAKEPVLWDGSVRLRAHGR